MPSLVIYSMHMGSRIEDQMIRLRREHEERGMRAAPDTPGIFSVSDVRDSEVLPHADSLSSFTSALSSYDFARSDLSPFLEFVFSAARATRVSDIHFEPEESGVRLRFRIDGVLGDAGRIPSDFYRLLSSRMKIMSGMKLNADRPQDGRFTIRYGSIDHEARTSSTPSHYGEAFVIRLLDPASIAIDLEGLGFRADDLAIISAEIGMPNGMILNTGPTGSGKTTTLYAFLKKRSRTSEKVITIEDPIEYSLPGIEQTQADPEAGYSFAAGLRAIVRQDPDVILVGEIRDAETAGIAIQAALTGHLVFSTVHANDAAGAVPRLLDLEVSRPSIGPALNCIVSQRLVRRLCDACKRPIPISPDQSSFFDSYIGHLPSRVDRSSIPLFSLFGPVGCPACGNAGYRGRIGIFEILRADQEFGKSIEAGAGDESIRERVLSGGMVTMQNDGVLKALRGITTLEEVIGATGPIPGLST